MSRCNLARVKLLARGVRNAGGERDHDRSVLVGRLEARGWSFAAQVRLQMSKDGIAIGLLGACDVDGQAEGRGVGIRQGIDAARKKLRELVFEKRTNVR